MMNLKNNESRNDSDQVDAAARKRHLMAFIADLQDALKGPLKDYRGAENDVQIQTQIPSALSKVRSLLVAMEESNSGKKKNLIPATLTWFITSDVQIRETAKAGRGIPRKQPVGIEIAAGDLPLFRINPNGLVARDLTLGNVQDSDALLSLGLWGSSRR
jgi:hypothetical protein